MSLLDNPPHTVDVQLMKPTQDKRGAYATLPDGEPITVPCSVQSVREWSTAEEDSTHGLQLFTLVRVFSRHWPGDVRSIVFWDGYEWECVGAPQHRSMGRRTQHYVVTLKRRWED